MPSPEAVTFQMGWSATDLVDEQLNVARNDKLTVGVGRDDNTAAGQFDLVIGGRNNETDIIPGSTGFTLADNTWYRLSFDFVRSGSSTWTASNVDLDNFGLTGAAFVSDVASVASYDDFDPGQGRNLDGSTSAWAFAGFDLSNGAEVIDNIEVEVAPIPEPGSLALIAAGGLLIAARRRRD